MPDNTDPPHDEEVHWLEVFQAHSGRLLRMVARRLGDRSAAEDVVQDTFLRAFRSRATVEPGCPIAPWLTTIALRAAMDAERRERRHRAVVDQGDRRSGDDDLIETLSRRDGLAVALRSLNERHRRVLLATAVDGTPYGTIAVHEEMDAAAVRALVMRARRRFREAYTDATDIRMPTGVTGLVLRVRARLQQLEPLATAQADIALCLVALTTAALAFAGPISASSTVATQTAGKAAPMVGAHAHEQPPGAGTAGKPIGVTASITPANQGGPRFVPRDVVGNAPAARTLGTPAGAASATAGRNGRGGTFTLGIWNSDGQSLSGYGGIEVKNCEANIGTRLECAAFDAVALLLEAAP